MSIQFLGDETDAKLSEDVIFWSLESVRATVNDIKAIVAAYHSASTPKTDTNGHKKPTNP